MSTQVLDRPDAIVALPAGTDVVATVERAVAPYAAVHRSRDFLVSSDSSRPTSIDGSVLQHLLGGLLSSACRRSHAAAPVRVRIVDVPGGVQIQVRDESRGFDRTTLAELQEPTRLPRLVDDAALRSAWAAREAGALVDVHTMPSGTTIALTLPLAA